MCYLGHDLDQERRGAAGSHEAISTLWTGEGKKGLMMFHDDIHPGSQPPFKKYDGSFWMMLNPCLK